MVSISINATAPFPKMLPPTISQSFLVAARGLMVGTQRLCAEPHQALLACAVVAAQTLECTLKAYLSFVGVTEKDLKFAFGHNLEALWLEAVKRGLNLQSNPPHWCVTLNSGHDKPYYFRYPIGLNGFVFPAIAPMAAELEAVLHSVESSVK